MRKDYKNVAIKTATKEQLDYLSRVSGLPRSKILEICINEIFQVGCTFKTLNFEFDNSQRGNTVYIYMNGKPRMHLTTRRDVE